MRFHYVNIAVGIFLFPPPYSENRKKLKDIPQQQSKFDRSASSNPPG